MAHDFVNQKTIDGDVYRAWRWKSDPRKTCITKNNGEHVECRLKEVWPFDDKIKELFDGVTIS